jgi:hypothetical protein
MVILWVVITDKSSQVVFSSKCVGWKILNLKLNYTTLSRTLLCFFPFFLFLEGGGVGLFFTSVHPQQHPFRKPIGIIRDCRTEVYFHVGVRRKKTCFSAPQYGRQSDKQEWCIKCSESTDHISVTDITFVWIGCVHFLLNVDRSLVLQNLLLTRISASSANAEMRGKEKCATPDQCGSN